MPLWESQMDCPGCGVAPGEYHHSACVLEQCPACGVPYQSCECDTQGFERLVWTGFWPGVMECREFGWYVRRVEGENWVRCAPDHPGAIEDLTRLLREAAWDPEQKRHQRRQ